MDVFTPPCTSDIPSSLFLLEDAATILFAERVVAMSPNGRYLLYESGRVIDIDGNELYTLLTNTDGAACSDENHQLASWVWSPDGERLAYVTTCQTANNTNNKVKWIQAVDSITGKSLWQQNIPTSLSLRAWTLDGNYLLLSHQAGYNMKDTSIWRLTPDGVGIPEMIIEPGLFLDIIP